jgi:hypothetical protein
VFDGWAKVVQQWSAEAAEAAESALWPRPHTELLDLVQAVERVRRTMAALPIRIVREPASRELQARQGHRRLWS